MSRLELDGFEEIVRELREHAPRAPAALYEQLRELGEQPAARPAQRATKSLRWRRRGVALALVGAALLAVGVGAALRSTQSGSENATPTIDTVQRQLFAGEQTSKAPADASASGVGSRGAAAAAPVIPSKRLAELRAKATLHVDTQEQLARATERAMRIARARGGYVARAKYSAPPRGEATSFLRLKIPAARAQRAWGELVALGTILSQDVSLVDLQRTVARQTISIRELEAQISELERTLASGTLGAEARDRVQLQLANKRAQVAGLKASREQLRNRGAMATVSLTLTTAELADAPAPPSGIEQAFDDGKDLLVRQLAWAVRAALVALPVALLLGLAVAARRARRRRIERELLER